MFMFGKVEECRVVFVLLKVRFFKGLIMIFGWGWYFSGCFICFIFILIGDIGGILVVVILVILCVILWICFIGFLV